ncbi:MAG: winged helix-turn-helix domain-containing protein [Gammaproteobacteria bacterium]|nr:winged helix-turn-helix domain-containing protein [Gammaproteobacteria bacterium]
MAYQYFKPCYDSIIDIIKNHPGLSAAMYLELLDDGMSPMAFNAALKRMVDKGFIKTQKLRSAQTGRLQTLFFSKNEEDTDTYPKWSDAWLLTKPWTHSGLGS